MFLCGIADEAGADLATQIKATKALGWSEIECRAVDGKNFTDLDERAFDAACAALDEAGIHVACFSSGIANWSRTLSDSPQTDYETLTRAISRMRKLNTRLIRIMSYKVPEDETINNTDVVAEVIKRMKHLATIAEENGIVLVHENCDNWGGRSYEHTLRLLDAVDSPALKLVFDTGNPVFRKDIRGKSPYSYQNALEFYNAVKEFVVHVHIKDGVMRNNSMEFTYPGEGSGFVKEICSDLFTRGYNGGFSIEPHLAVVFHDPSQKTSLDRFDSFVEYGKRMEHILKGAGFRYQQKTL